MGSKPAEEILKEKKIYQVINPRIVQAEPDIPLRDAVSLMQADHAGYLILARDKKVIGIFTETDVVRKVLNQDVDWNTPVKEFMTQDPVCLSPKDLVGKAIALMGSKRFYHIPLVDENNELTGILSVRSVIRFLSEFYPNEIYNLPPDPHQIIESPEGG